MHFMGNMYGECNWPIKQQHKCTMTNELGQELDITEWMWVRDSDSSVYGDFQVNYCPICGQKLKD